MGHPSASRGSTGNTGRTGEVISASQSSQANQYLTATLAIGRLEGSLVRGIQLGDVRLSREGRTLIPTKLYWNDRGIAKLEVSLAKGKKAHDKREAQKKKDAERSIRQALMRRR